ncbi:hypothetical protein [Amaricoccus tamworthensis]|uniref:hypothetical protein n=1 Tax=Amaricoccus tamworthensis TaxID=57002 RepID=UPI003C7BE690
MDCNTIQENRQKSAGSAPQNTRDTRMLPAQGTRSGFRLGLLEGELGNPEKLFKLAFGDYGGSDACR